jgi:uncharacterized membrane protein YdjX (TVP38/TMEM64 family)
LVKQLGPAGLLAVAACILPILGSLLLFWNMNPVGDWFRSHGLEGWALYALAFALAAGFAMLPSYAAGVLGGWAFGFAWGFPGALIGFSGGALIGYGVSTFATRGRVEEVIESNPRWKAVRDALVGSGFWRTFAIVALVRVPPNSAFALGNLAMASVRVRLLPFFLGTVVGMAPRTAAIVWVASLFRATTSDSGTPVDAESAASAASAMLGQWWVIAIGIALLLAVILIISEIAKRALARVTASAGGSGNPTTPPTPPLTPPPTAP